MALNFGENMYTAYYMPDDDLQERRKDGFETEQEAWDYVATRVCLGCRACILQGYAIYEDQHGNQDVMPIRGPWDTGCGAEWVVGLTKDFDAAESAEDLWAAGGWEKFEDSNHSPDNCKHDWKFIDVKDGNVVWQCDKCKTTYTDSGDGGDG